MNASMLIKFLPMLVMLVSLAYAAYTVQGMGSTLEPVLRAAAAPKNERNGTATASTGSQVQPAPSSLTDSLRDLFQIVRTPEQEQESNRAGSGQTSAAQDPNAAFVGGLTLNATLLQGRTQLAVISGRVYKAGQHLEDRGGQPSPLALTKVFAKKVVLEAGGKHYVLAYPDNLDSALAARGGNPGTEDAPGLQDLDPQLAVIQALLRSPLGGLGASLLGGQGKGPHTSAAPQPRRARRGRGAASAPP